MKYKVYVNPFAVIILNMMPETLHRKETGLSHYTKIRMGKGYTGPFLIGNKSRVVYRPILEWE